MKYIVDSLEMKRYDTNTIEKYGIPSLLLMERAALALAESVENYFSSGSRVLVAAGTGNNGGDGLAAGRILLLRGFKVTFFLAGPFEKCSEQTRMQLRILKNYGCSVTDIFPENEYDIIIDALFGIGLTRNVDGSFAEVISRINESDAMVCSCDMPSGISSDSGSVMGTAVKADMTVTFAFLKRGLFFYPGASYAGKISCAEIGITKESFLSSPPCMQSIDKEDLRLLLPARRADGNKGTFGKVLVIAGSRNMSGACEFCAESAFRSGAGMVKIYTEEANREILQKNLPEAMLQTYEENAENFEDLNAAVNWADCIVAGPGLSESATARLLLHKLLFCSFGDKRLVLDADALNMIAKLPEMQKQLKQLTASGVMVVLTPHVGEFSRLSGNSVPILKQFPVEYAVSFAAEYGVTLVYKDARTLTVLPDGQIYLNLSGNNGMATAGAGDVLAGIMAGLLAQGGQEKTIPALGVFLHGLSGDAAAARKGTYGMMARDIIDGLQEVLKKEE